MKKKRIVICIIASFLFLSGLSPYVVKITTRNREPLIDLDALLVSTNTGKPGNHDGGEESKASEDTKDPKEESKEDKDASGESDKEPKREVLRISVYSIAVFVDGKMYTYERKTDSLEGIETIMSKVRSANRIELEDNFAEAHAFRYILKKIRAVKKSGSIEVIFREEE